MLDRLDNAGGQLVDLGVGIAQFILVLAVAVIAARWARRRVRRRVRATPSPGLAVAAENAAVVSVYVVAITVVLALWGLTWSGLLTALSIGTVAAAFGLQDLLRSLVGGVLVVLERPFSLGDRIKVRDIEGRVEQIALRTTVIRADNGDRIALPNALVFSDPVINRSPNRVSRVLTLSGLDGAPAAARERALAALAGLPGLDAPPVVSVRAKQTRRVRRALDVLPGIDDAPDAEPRAIGLRIVWTGEDTPAARAAVKGRLQAAFPGARITSSGW